jgi:hypothetical protein
MKPATPRELRRFGVVMLLLAAFVAWRLHRRDVDLVVIEVVGGAIALLGLVGIAVPRAVALPYRGWMAIGHLMGRVTTPIVLTLVYFVVFTPVRVLLGVLGRDPLVRRWDRDAKTYWVPRAKQRFRAEDFERLS